MRNIFGGVDSEIFCVDNGVSCDHSSGHSMSEWLLSQILITRDAEYCNVAH